MPLNRPKGFANRAASEKPSPWWRALLGSWRVNNTVANCGGALHLLEEAAEAVGDWLEFRPDVDHESLFVGISGEGLKIGGVAKVFTTVPARAGVDREGVSLHTLRHTFASLLLQEGCDLISIQELLGHADLSSTAIYLHMEASHLQDAVGRHPLSAGASAAV